MKLSRCPVCHHHIHLEAVAQDEAASELLGLLSKLSASEASSCLSYLGLFRPAKSDLNNGRALRLLKELLGMTPNMSALCTALDSTTNQITQNRIASSDVKPLTNHNYLLKVLKSIPGWDLAVMTTSTGDSNAFALATNGKSKQSVDDAILDIDDTSWAERD